MNNPDLTERHAESVRVAAALRLENTRLSTENASLRAENRRLREREQLLFEETVRLHAGAENAR